MKLSVKIGVIVILIAFKIGNISGIALTKDYIGNDSCKCNDNCWPVLKDSITGLSPTQIFRFLKTLNKDCDKNVEFSEVSNELLFKIIELNPTNFLKTIDSRENQLDINEILRQIKRPINDGIDLVGISKKIGEVKIDSRHKEIILKSIQNAIDLTNK